MDVIFFPFLLVLNSVIGIYVWVVIASVVMSWLVAFNIVNYKNNFIRMSMEFLAVTTEPVLARIRRLLPSMGGFDFSPLALILCLWFLQAMIGRLMLKLFMVGSV